MSAEIRDLRRVALARARAGARAPRYALLACTVVLSAAGLKAIVRSSVPAAPAAPRTSADDRPLAVAGFAEAFARAYLTYDAAAPQDRADALEPFLASSLDDQAATAVPPTGARSVSWTATLGERRLGGARTAVTVAVAFEGAARLRHLVVVVSRDADGGLSVAQPPAFVGVPAPNDPAPRGGDEVRDGGLRAVVRRALGNYLSGAAGNLTADLLPGARLALPRPSLRLVELTDLVWMGERSLAASILAEDEDGVAYALQYELTVERRDRWYLAGLTTTPR